MRSPKSDFVNTKLQSALDQSLFGCLELVTKPHDEQSWIRLFEESGKERDLLVFPGNTPA
jgi:hypothetical protein